MGIDPHFPYFLTDLCEIRYKRFARNPIRNFAFHENLYREESAFLTGVNEITLTCAPLNGATFWQ